MKTIVILLLSFLIACTSKKSETPQEIAWSSSFKINEYEKTASSAATADQMDFVSKDHKTHLRILAHKDLGGLSPQDYIRNKVTQIRLLHEPQKAPYGGKITKSIECATRNQLSGDVQEGPDAIFATLGVFASEEFSFGLCEEAREKWKTQYLLLYCKKNSQMFEIKYFFDKALAWNLEPIAHCK